MVRLILNVSLIFCAFYLHIKGYENWTLHKWQIMYFSTSGHAHSYMYRRTSVVCRLSQWFLGYMKRTKPVEKKQMKMCARTERENKKGKYYRGGREYFPLIGLYKDEKQATWDQTILDNHRDQGFPTSHKVFMVRDKKTSTLSRNKNEQQ